MDRHVALPTSLFLAIGGLIGFVSLFLPWFHFAETGTPVFNGEWGFGPSFYSESPVKEGPQTTAGLLLAHNMTYQGTPYWIWHDLSFWSMITALASILLISLVTKKARRQSPRISGLFFLSASLMGLSLVAWAQFVEAAVQGVCFDSTCLSGIMGQWMSPSGSAATYWGMQIGFLGSMAAIALLVIAGSSGFFINRS